MHRRTEPVQSFPKAVIPSSCGELPVEVSLIAQLGPGSGNQLWRDALGRQRAHEEFVDALDEPSTRLAAPDFGKGEHSALFSFAVGPQGHPFHRHAGPRVFTAVSGSGGAQLRFSTASQLQMDADPHSFIQALHFIDIPPDCLFTVRFGGGTWHQFAAPAQRSPHPVFFALSCHTDELRGALSDEMRQRVLAGTATIPALTELLPGHVQALLDRTLADGSRIATTALSLHAPPDSLRDVVCRSLRSLMGRRHDALARWRDSIGYVSRRQREHAVESLAVPVAGSLLFEALREGFHHQDTFRLSVEGRGFSHLRASSLLADLLQGFLDHRPGGVSWLMRLRNALVKPLRLRTSPLGCPVSSLLTQGEGDTFLGRFPVLGQSIGEDGRRAQVLLGADDRHLRFRSCVGVQIVSDTRIDFTLGTRVRCSNVFGRVYMALIDDVHRRYVGPALLRAAVDSAVATANANASGPAAHAVTGAAAT
jgi:hypothetical protein